MIYFFQYYRVLMIIFVFFRHAYTLFSVGKILNGGSEAVSFFFLLAGFLQYKSLNQNSNISFKNHLKLSFARKKNYFIQYWFYLLLSSFYYYIIRIYSLEDIIFMDIKNIFLIQTFIPNFVNSVLSGAWYFIDYALCTFISYYIFKLIQKNNPKPFTSIFILVGLHFFINLILLSPLDTYHHFAFIYYSIYIRVIEYTVGLLIGKIHESNIKINHSTLLECISICLVLIVHIIDYFYYGTDINYLFSIMFATNSLLIFTFSFNDGYISKLFSKKNKVVDWICAHSFTIYLFNFIFMNYSVLTPWSPSPYLNLFVVCILLFVTSIFFDCISKRKKVV